MSSDVYVHTYMYVHTYCKCTIVLQDDVAREGTGTRMCVKVHVHVQQCLTMATMFMHTASSVLFRTMMWQLVYCAIIQFTSDLTWLHYQHYSSQHGHHVYTAHWPGLATHTLPNILTGEGFYPNMTPALHWTINKQLFVLMNRKTYSWVQCAVCLLPTKIQDPGITCCNVVHCVCGMGMWLCVYGMDCEHVLSGTTSVLITIIFPYTERGQLTRLGTTTSQEHVYECLWTGEVVHTEVAEAELVHHIWQSTVSLVYTPPLLWPHLFTQATHPPRLGCYPQTNLQTSVCTKDMVCVHPLSPRIPYLSLSRYHN